MPGDPPALRRAVLADRDSLSPDLRSSLSEKIGQAIESIEVYSRCRIPLIYVSFRSEVETRRIIEKRLKLGLPVAVPKTDTLDRRLAPYIIGNFEKDLQLGAYNILEPNPDRATPIPPEEIDVVLVPGSVFDRRCGRYGYGGGYYDRFLNDEARQAIRIGLAFHMQVLPEIPLRPHDQRMDIIVTERERIECSRPIATPCL